MLESPPVAAVTALVVVALLAGLGLGWWAAATAATARRAGLAAERDLLARRVGDLEQRRDDEGGLALALAPLTSSLARMERQVGAVERDRVEQFGRLDEQLSAVTASGEALRAQTASLAGALRSPNVRGAWGEVQLRRVVEHAGMLPRVDFDLQVPGTTADGTSVRPDAVIRLPGGKNVVVDAKAPLAAFLEAAAAVRPEETAQTASARQARASQAHAAALRGHVDTLAAKAYWTAFTPTPEVVVCFVPGESFLAAACEADPALLEHALARKVVLATPTTLMALLRTVALTWQQDAVSGSARELLETGRELYARLSTLGGHVGRLGRSLHRSVEDYNAVVGTLERRVLVTARRMSDLGLTDTPLAGGEPVESVPRPLTSAELVDDDRGALDDDRGTPADRP